MRKKVLIIGSGLGGLTTALRLKKEGYDVEIVEKNKNAGGRLNQLKKDGFTFDMGPSFFSMSYEFDDFYRETGIQKTIEFEELDPLYTINFRDTGKTYFIYKDIGKLAEQFKEIEPDFQLKMNRFLEATGKLFHDTEHRIVKRNFDSLFDFMNQLVRIPLHHSPKLFRSFWKEISRYFTSREVKEIFSLVSFFLGATPFDTPAIYTLLTYTELKHDGYYNVKGGMYKIVESLLDELKAQHVTVHYNREIIDYGADGSGIGHFIDHLGDTWKADIYVSNSDAASFRGKVLKRSGFEEKKLDKRKWTMAPFTIYLGVNGKVESLHQHNYYLGDNFTEYSKKIFKNSISLDRPYYYVNVLSRKNPLCAPPGAESIFILCPVPDLRFKPDWSDTEKLADTIIHDLSKRIGFDFPSNIVSKTIMNPVHWADAFNLYKGSGLSLAHNIGQIGPFRPKNYDEKFDNLFYVGSSTVPGTGLPMAVISSKLVTQRILYKYGSLL